MKKIFKELLCLTAIGLMLGDIPNVSAQDTASEEFTLEEITVTAQKREENKQKVPITMDVLSGEQLKELGNNNINQILENVASIVVNKTGQSLRVSLRGISDDQPEGSVQMSTPGVAINTDGVMTNRQKSGMGLFDIERVEVLYGPQSTLYASATPGGIVNVISAAPKTDKFEFSGTLEYGSFNLLHTEAAVNVPISGIFALRAAVNTSKRDGYLDNGGEDEDTKGARLRALIKPSESLSFLLTGEIAKTSNKGFGSVVVFDNQDDVDDPWTAAAGGGGGGARDITDKKIYGTMNLNTKFANIALTPSYSESSEPDSVGEMSGPFGVEVHAQSMERWEKNVEMRLNSPDDFFFKWIGGYIWYKSLDKRIDETVGTSNHRNQMNEQKTSAFYGNITYPFTDKLRGTAGVRVSNDTNDSINEEMPPGPGKEPVEETHMKYTNPDYKVGFEYDLGKDAMLYGDYTTSYRAQGMLFDETGEQFPPEELNSYQVGIKSRLMQNKLQVNSSAYYYDYKNYAGVSGYQYLIFNDLDGDGVATPGVTVDGQREVDAAFDENGKTYGNYRQLGLDLQVNAILTDKDKVDLSISYMNDEFTKMKFDLLQVTNDQGIPDQDYKGKGTTFTPDWTITMSYDHRFPLPNGGNITTRLDGRYKSEYYISFVEYEMRMDTTNSTADNIITQIVDMRKTRVQEAFFTGNFSASYLHADGKWTLTGYVKNLTNYAEKRSLVFGGQQMQISAPRTYGAVLSVRY